MLFAALLPIFGKQIGDQFVNFHVGSWNVGFVSLRFPCVCRHGLQTVNLVAISEMAG
jgi:hypothetical protein